MWSSVDEARERTVLEYKSRFYYGCNDGSSAGSAFARGWYAWRTRAATDAGSAASSSLRSMAAASASAQRSKSEGGLK